MVETFFEGVQAGRLDHGLWELIPLGESIVAIAVSSIYIYIWCLIISRFFKGKRKGEIEKER